MDRRHRQSADGMHRQSGAATVEYVVVGACILAALVAGPDVVRVLWTALQEAYTAFYYAISAAL